MSVRIAQSDLDIRRCFLVMTQLRTRITIDDFLAKVRRQEQDGYRLAYVENGGQIKAVAGFRVCEMLSRGRFLYVDDLVTEETERSKGYGDILFDCLIDYAKSQGCGRIDLDSGVQRSSAHRFYFKKRMQISSYHFTLELGD
ncbi:MAG: GNAT family N-acetyltransferase [Acidobacteriota bacterium]